MRPITTNILQSLLAGVLIGLGDTIYVVCANHILGSCLNLLMMIIGNSLGSLTFSKI